MDALIYVGDLKVISPKMIAKLERYGLELLHFKTTEGLMPYLREETTKMVLIRVNLEDDHNALRDQVIKLNEYCGGCVPIVLVTLQDSLKLRQIYLDLSYVHFLQYSSDNTVFRKNFETILAEVRYREQMRKLKFAVIDDDKLQLMAVQKLFSKHGIKDVSFFSHPDEFDAVEEIFDVYLVDLVMPGKSGDEIIFEIRKNCTDAVVLAVSSLENIEVMAMVLSLGANDFIVKPYNETIFMAKILSNSRLRYLLKENRKKAEELEEIAVRDPMTNLYNHRQIEMTLLELDKTYNDSGRPYSVIMMDIDYFKRINDDHGHTVGDRILIGIADKLKDLVGEKGIIGRYGGEEFIMILPDIREAEAFFFGEKIRRNIEKEIFHLGIKITISLGIAEADGSDLKIIERADAMLYNAKNMGRNRVVCYSHTS